MRKRLQAQNLYKAKIVDEIPAIGSSGNPLEVFEIEVDVAPTFDAGWVFVDFNDTTKRDLIFFHARSGTTLYYYRKNRDRLSNGSIDTFHEEDATIQGNDNSEWINKLFKNVDDFGEIEYPYGADNQIKVYGTTVQYGRQTFVVADTILDLDNGTQEIVFSYFDATINAIDTADLDLKNHLHLATIVTTAGVITSFTDQRKLILSNDMPPQSDWWIFEDETVVPVNNFGYGTDDIPNDSLLVPGSTTTNALDNLYNSILNNNVYGASTAGTDSYVITHPGAGLALASGLGIKVKADVGNTGSATVTITGVGTITIKKNVNEDLTTGDIQAGQIFQLFYDGTYAQLNSPYIVIPKDIGVAGEGFAVGEIPFNEVGPTTADATIARMIGADNARRRIEIRLIGNGTQFNEFKANLSKQGTPPTNLHWRFEQETNGLPNGTLIDANAIGDQTAAGLSTSAAEKTISLGGNVAWTGPMWLVGYMGTYATPTVDGTNYYNIYHSRKTTTTRQVRYYDGTGYGKLFSDNFEAFDNSMWTYNSLFSLTGGKMQLDYTGTTQFVNNLVSTQAFSSGYIEIGGTFTSGSDGFGTQGRASLLLYKDASNYAEIVHGGGQIDIINIVIGGVNVYTTSPAIATSPVAMKITYDFTSHNIKFWYNNAGVRTQLGTTQTFTLGISLSMWVTSFKGGGVGGGVAPTLADAFIYADNVAQASLTYDSYPFIYVSGAGFRNEVLAHADSDYYWKTGALGIINKAYNAGDTAAYYIDGIPLLQSALTASSDIFLNKKTLSTTPSSIYLGETTTDGLRIKLKPGKKLLSRKVTITKAQVLAMFTTPITLVPKPALNHCIIPQRVEIGIGNGVAYATNTNLRMTYKDLSGQIISDIASLINSSAKKMATININGQLAFTGSPPYTLNHVGVMYPTVNEAVVLGVSGGNPTAGTSELTVTTYYYVEAI